METTSFFLNEISAISWKCGECGGILHTPIGQELTAYDQKGQWHCPVCHEGDSTPMRRMNNLQKFIQEIAADHPGIGIVIAPADGNPQE